MFRNRSKVQGSMNSYETMTSIYTSTTGNSNSSEEYFNNTTFNGTNGRSGWPEIPRMIIITTFPVILVIGTIGNLLTFFIMQKGSLKHSSTCFYMAILALADTGKWILISYSFRLGTENEVNRQCCNTIIILLTKRSLEEQ